MDELDDFGEVLSPEATLRRRQARPWHQKLRWKAIGWWRYQRPRPVTRIRRDWQRSQHGWAPTDVWSMDDYICRVLGEMTAALRKTAHGHPCQGLAVCGGMPDSQPCSCEQDWNDTLDTIAEPLLAYKTHWDYPDSETTDQHVKREAKVIANAQHALRLLADHLPSMWD